MIGVETGCFVRKCVRSCLRGSFLRGTVVIQEAATPAAAAKAESSEEESSEEESDEEEKPAKGASAAAAAESSEEESSDEDSDVKEVCLLHHCRLGAAAHAVYAVFTVHADVTVSWGSFAAQ